MEAVCTIVTYLSFLFYKDRLSIWSGLTAGMLDGSFLGGLAAVIGNDVADPRKQDESTAVHLPM